MTTIQSLHFQGILNEGAYGKIYQVQLPSSEIKIVKVFLARKDYAEFFQNVLREIFFSKILLQQYYIADSINVYDDNTVTAAYIQHKAKCTVKELFPMSIYDIATKFKDVVDQLLFFHEQDIMHRDIKPHNILYDDKLYLIDTSLSIRSSIAKSTQKTVITLWYRPLEILNGKEYSHVADIWSLGLTLLEAYTGKALLCGLHKENEVIQYLHSYFTPNKIFIPGTSKEEIAFNNLLTSMLQVNPLHRANIYDVSQHEFWTLGMQTNVIPSTDSSPQKNSNLRPCSKRDMIYLPQMKYVNGPLEINEFLTFEARMKAFNAILRFTITYDLPFNIALLAFYFLDHIFQFSKEQNSLVISCLFTSIALESDILPCMQKIADFYLIKGPQLDQLFSRIVNNFRYLVRCPLPNTYKKARYIRDARMVALHMVDSTVWSLTVSQIQRMFTSPNASDLQWLEKIAKVEQNGTYKQLWINQLENNKANISFYF